MLIIGSILIIGVVTIFILQQQRPDSIAEERSAEAEAHFSYTYLTLNEQPFRFTEQTAEWFVVTSWASWCPDCAVQLQTLHALAALLSSSDTQFVAVNRGENPGTIQQYLKIVTPELLQSDLVVLKDPADYWYRNYEGRTMPETIIMNSAGVVREHIRRPIGEEELKALLAALANEG